MQVNRDKSIADAEFYKAQKEFWQHLGKNLSPKTFKNCPIWLH